MVPEIRGVVRRSGHHTLRLFFKQPVPDERALDLLASLSPHRVSFERANGLYFALDLEPEASVDKVRDVLDQWQEQGLIEYETCEARVQGGFGAAPEDTGGNEE